MPGKKTKITQQEFLRKAMRELGMTRQEFADRIECTKRRLDSWLLPTESEQCRTLDPSIKQFIKEILKDI